MAIKTRAQIQTDLDTILINTAAEGSITPEVLKGLMTDINDSFLNTNTDTNLQGLAPYSTTVQYYSGALVQYDYKWYKANTTTTVGAFDVAQWDFQSYVTYSGDLTIDTADVLTLNGTPLTLVAAIASHKIRLLNCSAEIIFDSVAYATNTQLDIYMSVGGAPNVQFTIPSLLAATANQYRLGTVTAGAQLAENTPLMVRVNSGNPTAGDSVLVVYFDYQVLD